MAASQEDYLVKATGTVKLCRGFRADRGRMLRCVVSLLLVPCVLLTQSAALGHSHGGSKPAGHDLRPHFHTTPTSAVYEHTGHHHGLGGHHHPHATGDEGPVPDTKTTPPALPPSDHDSSAVFTANVDLVASQRSSADTAPIGFSLWATSGLNLSATFLSANQQHEAANWTHPPPDSGYSCPLYVRHLALLI